MPCHEQNDRAMNSAATISDGARSSLGRHVNALDGLRAVAIILVLLFHLTPGHNSDQGLRSLFFKVADIGWSGVDLFFVLSGFLITGILLKAKSKQRPMRHFLARRMLRIVPAYFLALGIVFFLVPVATGSYPVPAASQQAPYWLYVANMFSVTYEQVFGPFGTGHFWSLAVEMQFYVLWPLVVYRGSTRTVLQVGAACLILAFTARAIAVSWGAPWWVTFGWMPMRMDGLIVGSLIAVALYADVSHARVRPFVRMVLAAGAMAVFAVAWFGWGGALFSTGEILSKAVLRVVLPTLVSLFYGAVQWASLQPNRLAAFLSHPFFEPIARYSYGIYITHFLLSPWLEANWGPRILARWTGGQDSATYLYFVLASGLSFVLAMMSFHLVEKHFLRLKSRF